jgi:hypothetical protein
LATAMKSISAVIRVVRFALGESAFKLKKMRALVTSLLANSARATVEF